jgi:hypothetical protein
MEDRSGINILIVVHSRIDGCGKNFNVIEEILLLASGRSYYFDDIYQKISTQLSFICSGSGINSAPKLGGF